MPTRLLRRLRTLFDRAAVAQSPGGATHLTGIPDPAYRVTASPSAAITLQDVTRTHNWTPSMLAERAERAGSPVWLDGEELTFLVRAQATNVRLYCGIQMDMQRLATSDTWALTVRSTALVRAIFSYTFIIDGIFPIGQTVQVWHGPLAPAPVARATTLTGTVRLERCFSAALGMERDLTISMPPGHTVPGNYPVVYAADGESVGGLAQVVEPLITTGAIPPIIIVGMHSGDSDSRAREYLPHLGLGRPDSDWL